MNCSGYHRAPFGALCLTQKLWNKPQNCISFTSKPASLGSCCVYSFYFIVHFLTLPVLSQDSHFRLSSQSRSYFRGKEKVIFRFCRSPKLEFQNHLNFFSDSPLEWTQFTLLSSDWRQMLLLRFLSRSKRVWIWCSFQWVSFCTGMAWLQKSFVNCN